MDDAWITAAEAFRLVSAATGVTSARRAICSRALAGLIKARAETLILDGRPVEDVDLPKGFWWAEGEDALQQNWLTGDFATWIDGRGHVKAFGVHFARSGIEALIGPSAASRAHAAAPATAGGRPPAPWWDDLWVEMCRQLWNGDLQPEKQGDIEAAMASWTSKHGHDPADSTIRARARKLWSALVKEDEN